MSRRRLRVTGSTGHHRARGRTVKDARASGGFTRVTGVFISKRVPAPLVHAELQKQVLPLKRRIAKIWEGTNKLKQNWYSSVETG